MNFFKNLRRVIRVALVILILNSINIGKLVAQQDAIFHQYMSGMQFFNPAYTGVPGCMELSFMSRNQWSDFAGNPKTNTLMFGTPINNQNSAVGLSLFNDKFGPVSQTGIFADYSYTIDLNSNGLKLSFGLKGGVTIYNSNLSELDVVDPSDPLFNVNIKNQTAMNFGLGLLLHKDNYFIGISSPRLLKNEITASDVSASSYREEIYLFTTAGYVFDINEFMKLKPYFIMRYEQSSPLSFDISTQVYLYDKLSLGALYRIGDAYGLMAGYRLTDQLEIGYAYDLTKIDEAQYTSSSHEFVLKYRFNYKKKSFVHPVYY